MPAWGKTFTTYAIVVDEVYRNGSAHVGWRQHAQRHCVRSHQSPECNTLHERWLRSWLRRQLETASPTLVGKAPHKRYGDCQSDRAETPATAGQHLPVRHCSARSPRGNRPHAGKSAVPERLPHQTSAPSGCRRSSRWRLSTIGWMITRAPPDARAPTHLHGVIAHPHTTTPGRPPRATPCQALHPRQPCQSASLQTAQIHARRRGAQKTFACQSLPAAPV